MLVNSVPLSLTTMVGRDRLAIAQSSTCVARMPEIDMSAIRRTQSRMKSSTSAKIRKRRLQANASDMKSKDQRPVAVAPALHL